jgi:hypothetical protein
MNWSDWDIACREQACRWADLCIQDPHSACEKHEESQVRDEEQVGQWLKTSDGQNLNKVRLILLQKSIYQSKNYILAPIPPTPL